MVKMRVDYPAGMSAADALAELKAACKQGDISGEVFVRRNTGHHTVEGDAADLVYVKLATSEKLIWSEDGEGADQTA